MYARFQKDPVKTVGGVDYPNSIPYSVTNGWMDRRTDRQMDRQGQILMSPDYRHGGIKKKFFFDFGDGGLVGGGGG